MRKFKVTKPEITVGYLLGHQTESDELINFGRIIQMFRDTMMISKEAYSTISWQNHNREFCEKNSKTK